MSTIGMQAEGTWLALGWTMLHFLWMGGIVGLVAAASRRALCRAVPQLRYLAGLFWLAVLAAIPGVVFCSVYRPLPQRPALTTTPAATRPAPPLTDTRAAAGTARGQAVAKSAVDSAATLVVQCQAALDALARYVPWLWLTGTPLTLALLAAGLVGAERLKRCSRPVADAAALVACRSLCASMGVAREVFLVVSDRVAAPLLVGVVRPMIVLPAAALAGWTSDQMEMILLHELAHVRRWDNLVNLLQRAIESVLFFHPVVWLLSNHVRLEREHCCDAIVVAHTGRPKVYAETLAALAMPELSPAYAAAVAANHQLVWRIRRILNVENKTMAVSRKSLAVLAAVASLAVATIVAQTQRTVAQSPAQPAAAAKPDKQAIGKQLEALRHLYQDAFGKVPSQIDALQEELKQHPNVRVAGGGFADLDGDGDPDVLISGASVSFDDVKVKGSDGTVSAAKLTLDGPIKGVVQSDDPLVLAQNRFVDVGTGTLLSEAISFTGAAGTPGKRAWGPEQATGAPDTPQAGDHTTAWASRTPDGGPEWLALTYKEPIDVVAVLVYETFNPGAVLGIDVTADTGAIEAKWTGADPPQVGANMGVSVIPLANARTKRIVLHVDSAKVPGWNEIDAVGLLDRAGKVHWATSAEASSTYAEVAAGSLAISVEPSYLNAKRDLGLTVTASPTRRQRPQAQPGATPSAQARCPQIATSFQCTSCHSAPHVRAYPTHQYGMRSADGPNRYDVYSTGGPKPAPARSDARRQQIDAIRAALEQLEAQIADDANQAEAQAKDQAKLKERESAMEQQRRTLRLWLEQAKPDTTDPMRATDRLKKPADEQDRSAPQREYEKTFTESLTRTKRALDERDLAVRQATAARLQAEKLQSDKQAELEKLIKQQEDLLKKLQQQIDELRGAKDKPKPPGGSPSSGTTGAPGAPGQASPPALPGAGAPPTSLPGLQPGSQPPLNLPPFAPGSGAVR